MPTKKTTDQDNEKRRGMFVAHGECRIVASADAAGGDAKPKRLEIVGYTGDAIRQWWNSYPVVVDLAGMKTGSVPIVLNHDTFSFDSVVGQADKVVNDGRQLLLGTDIVGESEEVQKFVRLSEKGVQFQASIGADLDPKRIDFVADGQKVVVNGREFTGPINVVRASTLRETSVLILGADAGTSAAIAALAMMEGSTMPNGNSQTPDPAGTPAPQSVAAGNSPVTPPAAQTPAPAVTPAVQASNQPAATPAPTGPLGITAGTDGASATHPQIDYTLLAKALVDQGAGEGVLKEIRAGRPSAPAAHVVAPVARDEKVLVAAMCMNGGLSNLEKRFDEKTLEAAHKIRREVALGKLIVEAARANGYSGTDYRISLDNAEDILAHAFPQRVQGSFSTTSISNVLSATYNKYVLEGFEEDDDPWELITSTKPLNDFKETKGVSLFGDFTFAKVGQTGNIEHGTLSDQVKSLKADLYAKHIQLPITDIINDDLGMLGGMGFMLGAGGKQALIQAIWTEFENDNANAYEAATPGSGNAFSLDALRKAYKASRSFVDPKGNKIVGNHQVLILPTALDLPGQEFMTSKEIRVTTSNKEYVTTNVMAGKYRIVSSRCLTSDTTWWTAGGRQTLNPMQAGFVDNKRAPTVESAVANFQTLGVQFRGWWGFAVGKGLKHSAYRMATA